MTQLVQEIDFTFNWMNAGLSRRLPRLRLVILLMCDKLKRWVRKEASLKLDKILTFRISEVKAVLGRRNTALLFGNYSLLQIQMEQNAKMEIHL